MGGIGIPGSHDAIGYPGSQDVQVECKKFIYGTENIFEIPVVTNRSKLNRIHTVDDIACRQICTCTK